MSAKPSVIVLAGPNGAGKSTLAPVRRLYDNSNRERPRLVSLGRRTLVRRVVDAKAWNTITAASEEQGA
jgi:predicted ABC-type ATPase